MDRAGGDATRWALAVLLLLPWAQRQEPGHSAPPEVDPHRRRSTLYVASRGSSEVAAVSRDTGEIIATIPVGRGPTGLAARRDGDRIYVVSAGSHTLQVIDGATRQVLDTVALAHGAAPAHLVLSGDERTLYIAASGLDTVYALEAGSLQQTAEIPVGRRPERLALSPDGRRLYVLCAGSGRVDLVDTLRPKVIASSAVGSRPSDMTLDPSTGAVHVVSSGAPTLRTIPEGASQAAEISIEAPAEAIALDGPARRLVVASPSAGRIFLLAPGTGATMRAIPVADASRLAIDPEGRIVYALSARRGLLVFVDRILGTVEKEVPAGKEPWDLVLIP